jgi:hypothetical protein
VAGPDLGQPSAPILSRVDKTAIANEAPEGADQQWGLTNVILHELTHGIARADHHGATGKCVFDGKIGDHFYTPIRNHFERVYYPDWPGRIWSMDSAWAELGDINQMRKNHNLPSVYIVPP